MNNCPTIFRSSVLPVLVGLLIALFTFAPAPAQAQIAAERPGFADDPAVIGARNFQVELGYQYIGTSLNDVSASSHNIGMVNLRYGITEFMELRAGVGSIGVEKFENEDEASSGYVGSSIGIRAPGTLIGAKVRFLNTSALTMSGVANVSFPTRTGSFANEDMRSRQELKLAVNGRLSPRFSVTVNGALSFFWSSGAQDDRVVKYIFLPRFNFSATDRIGGYVGYAGFYADDSNPFDAANTNFVEGGLTFLATPKTQIDVNGGYRLDDNYAIDSQFIFGLGLAQRF